jgi:hypothetical protein
MSLEGIHENSTKEKIQNGIDCLNCPDDVLDDYLTVIKVKYPSIYRQIIMARDFKHHSHNRLYVYNTVNRLLSMV